MQKRPPKRVSSSRMTLSDPSFVLAGRPAANLMAKVPHPGEQHRKTSLVSSSDDLIVAD